MKITVLGSGTSQGVPVIACDCHVCKSTDPKDKRLRCSVLIEVENKVFVIDTGPDFRQQMLQENVQQLNGVLFTHEHKDHVAGLDDVRAFNFKQKKDMHLYGSDRVHFAIKNEFHYAFHNNQYPGIPRLKLNLIDKEDFEIEGIKFTPIEVMHYKLPVTAFRIGNFAYVTDANFISETEKKKIKGTEMLIVNCLRKEKHISHFNLEEALEFIEEIGPEKAYLTHISHVFGTQEEINALLPENVECAYDGLKITGIYGE